MLTKTGRRWLRVIHIVFVAGLLGGLASILIVNGLTNLNTREIFVANYSIYTLFNLVVTLAFFGVVTTGVVYSVFTHWGLTKHWWVIGKWLGTVSLFILVWIWLGPAINGMVALSDIARDSNRVPDVYYDLKGSLALVIWLSLLIMCFLIAITIFRPWGQRTQKYEMKRSMVLVLVSIAIVLGGGLGILGYLDLESYRNMKISSPDLTRISDGMYTGTLTHTGFEYAVAVRVKSHRITGVGMVKNRESKFAQWAEGVLPRIVDHQSPNVDGITGATTTSKVLMKAVETTLEGAIK